MGARRLSLRASRPLRAQPGRGSSQDPQRTACDRLTRECGLRLRRVSRLGDAQAAGLSATTADGKRMTISSSRAGGRNDRRRHHWDLKGRKIDEDGRADLFALAWGPRRRPAAVRRSLGSGRKPGRHSEAHANRRQRQGRDYGIEPECCGESHRRGTEMQRLFEPYLHVLGPWLDPAGFVVVCCARPKSAPFRPAARSRTVPESYRKLRKWTPSE
jgi:hypothetical protein